METRHPTVYTTDIDVAAAHIKAGQLVAFPTETVYGLGANAWDAEAVDRIFAAKGRPADNPLIVHVASVDACAPLVAAMPELARMLFDAFAPGPLSLIMPKHPSVPPIVSGGLDTLAIRIPSHPVAQALLLAAGQPLAAPSANRSGRPSPTTWQAVADDLDGRIACILQGAPSDVGLESTVVDVTGPAPLVLRTGAVSLEALQAVVPSTTLYQRGRDEAPRSPGLKYRHYAPKASVAIESEALHVAAEVTSAKRAYIGLSRLPADHSFALVAECEDVEDYSHRLFAFFRACDQAGVNAIICEPVAPEGLGRALMDRIRRATANEV